MKALALLSFALCFGCSEVHFDLLEPAPVMDATLIIEEPPDAGPMIMDARAPDIDAGHSNLILRYDFNGVGTEVVDRTGHASAFIRGGALLNDSGTLQLDGVDDYVDLPNRSMASLQSATVIMWLSWSGGVCWQRAFDFGRSDAGEGGAGSALASLFLTFSTCPGGTLSLTYEQPPRSFNADSRISLAAGRSLQLAVAFDGPENRMRLFLDGSFVAETNVLFPLSQLDDVNAWLGRSQWAQDSFARVRYDEFRLYDRVLRDDEIADTFKRGPNSP